MKSRSRPKTNYMMYKLTQRRLKVLNVKALQMLVRLQVTQELYRNYSVIF
jgi:hypothetical protein